MARLAIAAIFALSLIACNANLEKRKQEYLQSGEDYASKGKDQEAAIQFRRALQLDARFVEAYYHLAQSQLRLNLLHEAFDSLQQAIQLDPQRLDARLDLGRLYLTSRDYRQGQEEAEFILGRDKQNAAAHQLLGACFVAQNKPAQALPEFAKVTELTPGEPAAFINLALAELSLQRSPDAERHLLKAVEVGPKFPLAYVTLANYYRSQHQDAQAADVLRRGIAANSEARELYLDWANLLYAEGKQPQAAEVLEGLRQRQPKSVEVAKALASFYLRHQQFDKAVDEYRRALVLNADDLGTKQELVEVYLANKQWSDAEVLTNQILRERPKNVAAHVARDRILMAKGNLAEAISDLEQQVSASPESAPAHFYLGEAYWKTGKQLRAKVEFGQALLGLGENADVLRALAQLNAELGEPAAARDYAERLVKLNGADASAHLLLGIIDGQSQQYGPALAELRAAAQLQPNDPTIHLNLALAATGAQDTAVAESEFEAALQLNPRYAEALARLAAYWSGHNQSARAVARVQQYLAQYPNDAQGHLILGSVQFERKQYDSAQAEFERAIQLDPQLVQGYLSLGRIAQERGQVAVAINQYQRAQTLQPKFALLPAFIGNLYLNQGNLKEARQYYQQALAIDPNLAVAAANLAWVYTQQADANLDEALALAQRAKRYMPDQESVTDTLAWVEYKKGSYATAIPLLQQCVEKAPNRAVYRYHLGMALVAQGAKAPGRAQLETALRLKLSGNDAEQARSALQQVRGLSHN